MNCCILILVGTCALSAYAIPEPSHELSQFVDSFDISGFPCGQGKRVQANKSVDGHPLTVGGVTYEHGFGARPESAVAFTANGGPLSFTARVAIDDDAAKAGSGKSYGQPMATCYSKSCTFGLSLTIR